MLYEWQVGEVAIGRLVFYVLFLESGLYIIRPTICVANPYLTGKNQTFGTTLTGFAVVGGCFLQTSLLCCQARRVKSRLFLSREANTCICNPGPSHSCQNTSKIRKLQYFLLGVTIHPYTFLQ